MMGGRSIVAGMWPKVSEAVFEWSQEPSSLVKTLPMSCQAPPQSALLGLAGPVFAENGDVMLSRAIVWVLPSVLGSGS
ncbi:hypothetical protein [Streptomyces sp. SID8499]|uniref:hypothetical protein n=1 Tax=Streptomyces sp. SID8499 TaxID=2706106 RepID=UPI001EF2E30B|nr:hypothetical protein [Streptomyces sp. SID8499]